MRRIKPAYSRAIAPRGRAVTLAAAVILASCALPDPDDSAYWSGSDCESDILGVGEPRAEERYWPEPFYRAWISEKDEVAAYAAVTSSALQRMEAQYADAGEPDVLPPLLLSPYVWDMEFLCGNRISSFLDIETQPRLSKETVAGLLESDLVEAACSTADICPYPHRGTVAYMKVSRVYRGPDSRHTVFAVFWAGSWGPCRDLPWDPCVASEVFYSHTWNDHVQLERDGAEWRVVSHKTVGTAP